MGRPLWTVLACTTLPFDTSPASGQVLRPGFEFGNFIDIPVVLAIRIVSESFSVANATVFKTWLPAIRTAFHLVIDGNASSFERDNPAPDFDPDRGCNAIT
jgi:hypothetical protein